MKERRCKNKECNKILPEGYKGKYCEACMNKKAHGIKNILTGVCSVLGVVFLILKRKK